MSEYAVDIEVVWEGIRIRAEFSPNYYGSGDYKVAHLQLHVLSPEGHPLPVTETGYRSHFADYICPVDQVEQHVLNWLDEEALKPEWHRHLNNYNQRELF